MDWYQVSRVEVFPSLGHAQAPFQVVGTFREAVRRAFDYWQNVANIYFQEVSSASGADLKIEFSPVRHGDGYDFDGPGMLNAS